MIEFHHHNVMLPDGTETRPGSPLIAEQPLCVDAIKLFKSFSCRSVLDLGCLEGGFAAEFSRHFDDVAAIEVRDSNFARCQALINAGMNVRFIQDDAWNVDRHGSVDGIYCGGLLYHLDRPREFLRLLAQRTDRVCLIDTHFATDTLNPKFNQSAICQNEGVRGRWYSEFGDDTAFANRDEHTLSSWSNRESFWIHRDDIVGAIQSAGFSIVLERLGTTLDANQRTMFVCVK